MKLFVTLVLGVVVVEDELDFLIEKQRQCHQMTCLYFDGSCHTFLCMMGGAIVAMR